MNTVLRGLSWDHPRGHPPLISASSLYRETRPEVSIEWETRSVADFASGSLERYIGAFDLVTIDHPVIGEAVEHNWLVAFDDLLTTEEIRSIQDASIDARLHLYELHGRTWALPVDSATHSCAYRNDYLDTPPLDWNGVLELARTTHRVGVPMAPMSVAPIFLSLYEHLSERPWEGDRIADAPAAVAALSELKALSENLPQECLESGGIGLLRRMALSDDYDYLAFVFGYSTYGRHELGASISFGPVPRFRDGTVLQPVVGGVGIAVLAEAPLAREAADFASWVCSERVQNGVYVGSGGQPAARASWFDEHNDALTGGFYTATRASFDHAYVRPRSARFAQSQHGIGALVHAYLTERVTLSDTVDSLGAL